MHRRPVRRAEPAVSQNAKMRFAGRARPETIGWGARISNLGMAESKSAALPLGDAPTPLQHALQRRRRGPYWLGRTPATGVRRTRWLAFASGWLRCWACLALSALPAGCGEFPLQYAVPEARRAGHLPGHAAFQDGRRHGAQGALPAVAPVVRPVPGLALLAEPQRGGARAMRIGPPVPDRRSIAPTTASWIACGNAWTAARNGARAGAPR